MHHNEWQVGDLVTCVKGSQCFTEGRIYDYAGVDKIHHNCAIKFDDVGDFNGKAFECFEWHSRPGVATTPTLETMLTEWRDLEARAQAAQAEADALFEHAGQCHGEIVVRLAELGWGAPVETLDDSNGWVEWNGGECPVAEGTLIDQRLRDGREYFGSKVGQFGNSTRPAFWRHDGDRAEVVAYRFSPSTQP